MSVVQGGVVAALDVGGTTIKGLLVDAGGGRTVECVRPSPARAGAHAVIRAVRAVLADLVAGTEDDVRAVGFAVPGIVSDGVARYAAHLGWRDVPASAFVDNILPGVPVVLENDARCAAHGDRVLGATRGVDDGCVVVIGTGVGAFLVSGGRSVVGARASAGELGHIPVVANGEACACGQHGCLNAYASAASLSRRYAALTGTPLPAEEIVASANRDAAARRVWQDAIDTLAIACTTLTMIQDPAVIAFAGGLSGAGNALLTPLTEAVTTALAWRPPPRLVISPLGGWAGRYGVALHAWEAAGVPVDASTWA